MFLENPTKSENHIVNPKEENRRETAFYICCFPLVLGEGRLKKREGSPRRGEEAKKKKAEKRRILKNSEKFSGEERPEEGGEGRET